MAKTPQKQKVASNAGVPNGALTVLQRVFIRFCSTMPRSIQECCILGIVLFGTTTAGSQDNGMRGQFSWPTYADVLAKDNGWQKVSDLGLPEREYDDLRRITSTWLRTHCPSFFRDRRALGTLSAKRIQLQASDAKQVVVEEAGDWEGDSGSCSCGPLLNCRTWVLQFDKNSTTVRLVYSGLGLLPRNTRNNGFSDVVTASMKSPNVVEYTAWRYSGKDYVAFRKKQEHIKRE